MTLWYVEKRTTPSSVWDEGSLATLRDALTAEKEYSMLGSNSLLRLRESCTENVYPPGMLTTNTVSEG